jgi:hypothetical protein
MGRIAGCCRKGIWHAERYMRLRLTGMKVAFTCHSERSEESAFSVRLQKSRFSGFWSPMDSTGVPKSDFVAALLRMIGLVDYRRSPAKPAAAGGSSLKTDKKADPSCRLSRDPVGTGQQGADYSEVFKWRSAQGLQVEIGTSLRPG